MRAVLDTNVVISSYLNAAGPSGRIRTAVHRQDFMLVVSEELLAEYERVLSYPRVARLHGLSRDEIGEQIAGIRTMALLVPLAHIPNLIPEDPADNDVVATAVAGEAEYIVSGDEDLHRLGTYQGVQIVMPALLLQVLNR